MRRITAAVATAALALGFTVALAGPAAATITSPSNGAVLRDHATLSSSGGFDDSTLDHCSWFGGSGGDTRIQLVNSGGTAVVNQFWNTGGSRSIDIDTRDFPNGNYVVKDILTVRKNGGFAGLGCSNETRNNQINVSIDNFVDVTYSGATTAPRNTTVPVSATVVDGVDGSRVAGISVTFSLSAGGGSATATTNSNGVASTTLPVNGNARTASLSIAAAGTSSWRGKTITRSFEVTKNGTATSLTPTGPSVHGQPGSTERQGPCSLPQPGDLEDHLYDPLRGSRDGLHLTH